MLPALQIGHEWLGIRQALQNGVKIARIAEILQASPDSPQVDPRGGKLPTEPARLPRLPLLTPAAAAADARSSGSGHSLSGRNPLTACSAVACGLIAAWNSILRCANPSGAVASPILGFRAGSGGRQLGDRDGVDVDVN